MARDLKQVYKSNIVTDHTEKEQNRSDKTVDYQDHVKERTKTRVPRLRCSTSPAKCTPALAVTRVAAVLVEFPTDAICINNDESSTSSSRTDWRGTRTLFKTFTQNRRRIGAACRWR
ncbi:hypothetical protein GN958_ATG02187 [Phytophthora infestans]|uniref:Uncharacterized protein n=1 Tax=Phytophthora infestans TaxID=4787 RepID=A0A8S9VB71_PHYIN|nr:hypothetical protein GN958_ATG02187 [Phytophthora infestans]